ncbi:MULTISPECIES: hypothetical protein [unclassified Modicisalibacter]|uniref:hypothetical protein n=1 Tax=unclassified Modicisalibacter TaxID=2679913 RepID=UPI001CCEB89C|nr:MULTISPECIES: hypothetical protein [unclassified Modicisalibacter]MBZ9560147.1 hypothetical protein [Modicisalibacter sp. R2A 31.J]MBZ9576055.1 hypothetical protein [Modicisalibacter sp. MOD 31.J]
MSALDPIRRERCQDRQTRLPSRPPMPDFYMPAMPPLGLIQAVETRLRDWRRRRQFRRRFLPLLDHEDPILADMGHCRAEIEWAASLPWREDATRALLERRERRLAATRRAPYRERATAPPA